MKLKPFRLEEWLDAREHDVRYNLAASTGPNWSLAQVMELMNDTDRKRFFEGGLTYCPSGGHESLREELGDWYGVGAEDIQIVNGASEALLILFHLAAEPGANVVLPKPGYPPFTLMPESMGLEVRHYRQRHENDFRIDVDELRNLVDANTRIVGINTPHNPTGSVVDRETLEAIEALCQEHGAQLVVDEVYHPIYHGVDRPSAAAFTGATVLGDLSKALSMAGLRTGWMLERDPERRRCYWNAKATFSISNSYPGEVLAEVAVRNRHQVFARAREISTRNLATLDKCFKEHADLLSWVRPRGGMTGFPRFLGAENSRPFCEAAYERGVLLAPGDCFDAPQHFRLGFGACADGFEDAVGILAEAAASVEKSIA